MITKTHSQNHWFCTDVKAKSESRCCLTSHFSFKENKVLKKNTVQIIGQIMRPSQKIRASASVAAVLFGETCFEKAIQFLKLAKNDCMGACYHLYSFCTHFCDVCVSVERRQQWALCRAGIRSAQHPKEPTGTFYGRFPGSGFTRNGEIPFWLQKSSGFSRLRLSGSTSGGPPSVFQ